MFPGGFLEFQACHPSLCENKMMTTSGQHKVPAMSSMSQPCMPVANLGPTKILPFLYLGSQQDALSHETMKVREMMDWCYVSINFANHRPARPVYLLWFQVSIYDKINMLSTDNIIGIEHFKRLTQL